MTDIESNMDKRTRKYIYIFRNIEESQIECLKCIESRYHIIGRLKYNKKFNISGFICFQNTKTLYAAAKSLNIKNMHDIKQCEEDSFNGHIKIKRMKNVWEKGEIKQSHKPVNVEMSTQMIKFMLSNQDIVKEAMMQNTELTKQNILLTNSIVNNNLTQNNIRNSNNTKNSHNRVANINVFLNTECKDAITLKEFIEKIEVTDHDIEMITEKGYAECTADMIKRELNNYQLRNRPIHCTDVKREVMHIKNTDGWVKEKGRESQSVRSAISKISKNQIKKLFEYYNDGNSAIGTRLFEEKIAAMKQINDGTTDPDTANRKILQNIFEFIKVDLEMMEMEEEYGQSEPFTENV